VELAIRRILLLHAIILTVGGIPLIYLGDEIGTLNDYSYRQDPAKAGDSRWAHRPRADWTKMARRSDENTIEGRIYLGLQRLIQLRKQTPAFSNGQLQVMNTGNVHVLGYVRTYQHASVLVFANFTEREQTISANLLRLYGLSYQFTDLISGEAHPLKDLTLPPYGFVCLAAAPMA
jgi:glycosidase